MTDLSENELVSLIRSKLDINEEADVSLDSNWKDLRFDIIIEDRKRFKKVFLEIKPKAGIDSLAMLNLYKDYVERNPEPEGFEPRFALVTKSISTRVSDLAKMLNIDVVIVPKETKLPGEAANATLGTLKISSEKSWKVVSGLIKLKTSSIRNLSIVQGVSYGWTHYTINNLITHGIAKKNGNHISISDMDKLLNGVAWERPTQALVVKELKLSYKDVFEASAEMTEIFGSQKIEHAFCSYMAGTQYTGYGVRFDSIQCYLDNNEVGNIGELLGANEDGSGIKLQIMAPDREVFSETRMIGNTRVTSPSQTLLDLAGLGYKAKDLTKAMVAAYGQL